MADAKNRFSELMNRALSEGPQRVRRRQEAVILISEEAYERLTGKRPDFKQYLMAGEGLEDIDITRDQTPGRDISL